MRLLQTNSLKLFEFGGSNVPDYAILSHTWGKEEITLQDIQKGRRKKSNGYQKVKKACSVALADGFYYIWIDTCCIDKTSSAELSEALNSMYRWYQEAEKCYAYLADVDLDRIDQTDFSKNDQFWNSKWFTRGWTLQELIAPSTVIFLNSKWQEIGTKSNLQWIISEITGIPSVFLLGDDIQYASVAQRMSWASNRETTRVEDLAYCLMGLFGIYMPMLYGEGERAFIRLQEEIIKVSDDHSLFSWTSKEDHKGILATSPAAFADSGNIIPIDRSFTTSNASTISSRGVRVSLRLIEIGQQGTSLAVLHCTEIGKENMRLAIFLRDVFLTNQDFVREESSELRLIDLDILDLRQYPLTSLYVRHWRPTRNRKWDDIEKFAIKLEGIKKQEVDLRTTGLNSNCEIFEGLIFINLAAMPDETIARLLVVCKDGKFFQILLNKYRRSVSVNISTSKIRQDLNVLPKEQNDQDQIVKALGDGDKVHIAIKKRVLLFHESRCLTGVVEVNYTSTLKGVWLEHITLLGEGALIKNPLSSAALQGFISVVKFFLDGERAEINYVDESGRTPLSWAAEGGDVATFKFLLAKLIMLEGNEKSGENRGSSSRNISLRLPLKIQESKVNSKESGVSWIDFKDANGRKPLKIQESKVNSKESGVSWIDFKDANGRTPLSYSAENGHEVIVQMLLETGKVNANSRDIWSRAPLWFAAQRGHEVVSRLLVDFGRADVDLKDYWYRTPLSLAAQSGHEAIIRVLLNEDKIDVNSKDSWNRTPLCHAAAKGYKSIVQLLLNSGKVDSSIKDNRNLTPLDYAMKNGYDAIAQLLRKYAK